MGLGQDIRRQNVIAAVVLTCSVSLAWGQQLPLDQELLRQSQAGNAVRVGELLKQGARADAKSDGGRTALHWAAHAGHREVMRLLIERGADVNAKDTTNF